MKKGFVVASIILGIGLCFAIGEISIRFLNPKPPVQFIRNKGSLHLYEQNGSPVWVEQDGNPIRFRPCIGSKDSNEIRVAIFGSSIFYGSGVPPKENFSLSLEKKLSETWNRPVCIVNYAQPGYGHQNKFAVAVHEIPKFKPHLVIWEVWLNDTSRYVLLGDTAYNTDKLITQEDGYPSLLGFSGGFNQWLLSVSKLYEFAAFTLNEDKNRGRVGDLWKEFAEEHTRELVQFVKEQGAELWVANCPPLHTPFETQRKTPQREYVPVESVLEELSVPFIRLRDEFGEKTIEDVRIDTCCHYNAEGHRLIAERFSEIIPKTFPALGGK